MSYNNKKYKKTYTKPKKKKCDKKSIYNYFIRLFARRDYSKKELITNGNNKYEDANDVIMEVIFELEEQNIVDDERFAESYIYMKYQEGYGRNRIKRDISFKKGIPDYLVTQEFDKYDWFELAKETKELRYGNEKTEDYKELLKQKNYLLRRGFSNDEVHYAFEKNED